MTDFGLDKRVTYKELGIQQKSDEVKEMTQPLSSYYFATNYIIIRERASS